MPQSRINTAGPMPRFLHVLTAIHAVGAVACFVMATGSAISDEFRASLAVSGGSASMLAIFGDGTWAFLLFVGMVLAVLAYASWRRRWEARSMTLIAYGIGARSASRCAIRRAGVLACCPLMVPAPASIQARVDLEEQPEARPGEYHLSERQYECE